MFHDLTDAEEQALLERAMAWQRDKFDGGYGAICWPAELGGAGLAGGVRGGLRGGGGELRDARPPRDVQRHAAPRRPDDRERSARRSSRRELIPRFLRTNELCCQLFSEPGAGSDLAGLSTRAVRDGDEWVVNGQKAWSSGARFSAWGELIARTDPDVPKHAGLTAFLLPMDTPGITIVPIRQMSGGASFNEVFLDDVRIPDRLRLGDEGDGWKVALTTLGFERGTSGSDRGDQAVGGSWEQLRALAEWLDATTVPIHRQDLARLYSLDRIRSFLALRAAARRRASAVPPGPEASAGKLLWTQWMTAAGDVAAGCSARASSPTPASGAPTPGASTCSARPATASPAGPTRSSATSSASVCSACRASRAFDRDVPFRDVPR